MMTLLEQFMQESRDFLQGIGEKLLALEDAPGDAPLINELFRLVHTLKGNSGLFDFSAMTRVLHAAEDTMDAVRAGRLPYSRELADRLLEVVDFVSLLLDEIEETGAIAFEQAEAAEKLAQVLRELTAQAKDPEGGQALTLASEPDAPKSGRAPEPSPPSLAEIPEEARLAAFRTAMAGSPVFLVSYHPEEECFFKGEDPFYQARQVPGFLWGRALARAPWGKLSEFDCFRSLLDYHVLAVATRTELEHHFRYTPEQVQLSPLAAFAVVRPQGRPDPGGCQDFLAEALALLDQGDLEGLAQKARARLEQSAPDSWLSSALRWLLALIEAVPTEREAMRRLLVALETQTPPDFADLAVIPPAEGKSPPGLPEADHSSRTTAAPLTAEEYARLHELLAVQAEILSLPEDVAWLPGRLKACAQTIAACLAALGDDAAEVEEALGSALAARSAAPLQTWLDAFRESLTPPTDTASGTDLSGPAAPQPQPATAPARPEQAAAAPEPETQSCRRPKDPPENKVLKVDQAKVDRLMNLIGEMVVAKNALPYLAKRAEEEFGVRELSRDLKAHYVVINRIAEEMQDAIMQMRMMPLSCIFQRFPRLVRDLSRKLGKDVELKLEGEETEADKKVIEVLAEPLLHLVRNSLDHGIEPPAERLAAGKPAKGLLTILAFQESDHIQIEVRDDGRGIDPAVLKRKAYEKGLITEEELERMSDREALYLVFAPGFSMAETVTDLSGRGVGMDVVRTAIDKVGGELELQSEVGKGTTLRLSLPLSMAVTNVMVIESNGQIFGVPMDLVVETLRVPRAAIKSIKGRQVMVWRGRLLPLVALNHLLAIPAEPRPDEEDKLAVLAVRIGGEQMGLLIDDFREVVDVILKPLPGKLAALSCYAGTALLGDGSVLMILNPKELIR